MKTFLVGTFLALLLLVSAAPHALAQPVRDSNATGIFDNPLESDSLEELLLEVLRGIVRVLSIFLVVAFVYVGYKFASAQGNAENLSKARTALMWTVIGAAILLGAEGIANVIIETGKSLEP